MLAAECNQIPDRWVIAAFDVCSQELPALTEAEGVDRRCRAEDVVSRQLGADMFDLFGQVTEECGATICGAGVTNLDNVDVGPRD